MKDDKRPPEPDQTSAEQFKAENAEENISRQLKAEAARDDGKSKGEDKEAVGEGKEQVLAVGEPPKFPTQDEFQKEVAKEDPAPEEEKGGMEHSFETGMAEGGGIFDQLTDQIGQSIVEKLTSKDQEPDKIPGQDDQSKWNDLADEFSPASASGEDRAREKESEMDER